MKEFFKNINYCLVLFIMYVLKSIILPAGWVDFGMVAVLGIFYLVKYFGVEYITARLSVVTEAMYRAETEQKFQSLAQEVQSVKMSTSNPIQGFGRGKR